MGNQVPVQSDTPWNLILEFNLLAQFEDDFKRNFKIVGSNSLANVRDAYNYYK